MKQTIIDEVFLFQCSCCGECCSGNMDININLYDLYKIAQKLGFPSTEQLFHQKFVKLAEGQNGAWIPRINFRRKPFPFCPWLINDLGDDSVLRGFCSLHPQDKPLVCKLAPAGRIADLAGGSEQYVLTAPTENCPGMESCCENSLSELKKELRHELDFELRFFALLESMSGRGRDAYERIYGLDCALPFENQMRALETEFGIE